MGAEGGRSGKVGPHGVLLFVYGAAVHEALFAWGLRREYGGGPARGFLRGPVPHLIVALSGGLFVMLLFLPLLNSCYGARGRTLAWKVLLGGLYGIGATFLTLAGSSVVGGALLVTTTLSQPVPAAQPALTHGWWAAAPYGAFLMALEIATYAGGPVVSGMPVEFAYGVGGALYALSVTAGARAATDGGLGLWDRGKLSLALGGLGVLFVSVPYVSVPLGVLAVSYGIGSGAWGRRAGRDKVAGRVGTALGVICVLWLLYGFAVYHHASRLAGSRHP